MLWAELVIVGAGTVFAALIAPALVAAGFIWIVVIGMAARKVVTLLFG